MTTLAEKVAANRPAAGGNPPAGKGHPAGGNAAGAKGVPPGGGAVPAKAVAPNASGGPAGQANATPAEKPKGPILAPEKRKALGRGLESLLGPPRVAAPVSRPAGPPQVEPANRPVGPSTSAVPSTAVAHPVPDSQLPETRSASVAGTTEPTAAHSIPAEPTQPASIPATGSTPERTAVPALNAGQAQAGAGLADAPAAISGSAPETVSGSAAQVSDAGWHMPAPGTFTGANPAVPHGAAGASESIAGVSLGTDIQAQAARRAADGSVIVELDVNLIDKNPYQTRHFTAEDDEELLALAESIKSQGLIQPITVRPGRDGRYILITGQRRTNATRLAGLGTIAAVVRHVSDQQAAEMTVIENLMREDLNVMDQVRAFVMLSTTFQMTQSEIAGRIGSSRESVANYMRLARLPEEVQGFLRNNELEFSHARLLLRLQDDGVILRVARKAAEEHMSVEALEDLVREKAYPVEGQEKKQGKARWVDPNVRAAQHSLERVLGMRVRIRDSRGKGKILIEYGSLEDFDRLVKVLGGKG